MIFKRKKTITLDDISINTFKKCLNGDFSALEYKAEQWPEIYAMFEKNTRGNERNIQLELRKKIAIKENELYLVDNFLFIIRSAFKSFLYSGDFEFLSIIEKAATSLKAYGFYFNVEKDLIKEHNRLTKQAKNKQHEIKEYINTLKESEKGALSFEALIAIVGKYSGAGIINQRNTTMSEFIATYKLMLKNG